MELDHLAIAGVDLARTRAWTEDRLGLPMQTGGVHDRFGTHNMLLGLQEGLYLEAIAPNPEAPVPDRPRWFGLDVPPHPPRLSTWIVRVEDLEATVSALPMAGEILELSRGDLRWRMAVPREGALPWDGVFPALIQWDAGHAIHAIDISPLRLTQVTVSHPDAQGLAQLLPQLAADPRIAFKTGVAGLSARFDGPDGEVAL